MFPIHDDNPQYEVPVMTFLLITLNVFAWIFIQHMGQGHRFLLSLCQHGLIPADLGLFAIEVSRDLTDCKLNSLIWLDLFSSMFMHASLMHLFGNMWFLWIFGGNVEDSMGAIRFLIFYIACGICAAVAQIFSEPASLVPIVGASGAVGGVMGAYLILYPWVKVHVHIFIAIFRVPAIGMLLFWVLWQIVNGIRFVGEVSDVAFWAHLGGFISGAVLIWLLKNDKLLLKNPRHGWYNES